MYGLSIITNVKDDKHQLLESIPTLWFSSSLDKIASIWLEEIEDIDQPDLLRKAIIEDGFWYTNYYRQYIHYVVRIFKVEEDVEINI